MRRQHFRSPAAAHFRAPDRDRDRDRIKGPRHRRSRWPANTPSYPHLNCHIPHPSSSFPLLLQSTSFTSLPSVHNSLSESQRSPLTNHHLARARIHTLRHASQMEISTYTNYILLLASTTTLRHSRHHGRLRSLIRLAVTPCWSRSQRAFLSPYTTSLMRRCKLSTFSPHSPHSLHLPLC
jgi:hypothetical protein